MTPFERGLYRNDERTAVSVAAHVAVSPSTVPAVVHHAHRLEYRQPDAGGRGRLVRLRNHRERAGAGPDRPGAVSAAAWPRARGRANRRPSQPPFDSHYLLRDRGQRFAEPPRAGDVFRPSDRTGVWPSA